MDLHIYNQSFLVTGASSGLGYAVAEALVKEGAKVIINARNKEKLAEFQKTYPNQIEVVIGDLIDEATISALEYAAKTHQIVGAFINAGGPPAKSTTETTMEDWDNAYQLLVRWKIDLVQRLIPYFQKKQYGRILFSESQSVKQPIQNLVLSNAMRMPVIGFSKTLSEEVGKEGVTVNVVAPGSHETKAMERLYAKKSKTENISIDEAKKQFESKIAVGFIGDPKDYASLCIWLLSPHAKYITGQTISIDGGSVKYSFG